MTIWDVAQVLPRWGATVLRSDEADSLVAQQDHGIDRQRALRWNPRSD
jgi:hypothetical protein